MEVTASKPKNNPNQSLPPKRGQIKKEILRKFLKSVVSIAGGSKRKGRQNERPLSSTSTTPHETPNINPFSSSKVVKIQLKQMKITVSKPKNNSNQSLPPKRGQIKMNILSKFLKSAVTVASIVGRSKRKRKGK